MRYRRPAPDPEDPAEPRPEPEVAEEEESAPAPVAGDEEPQEGRLTMLRNDQRKAVNLVCSGHDLGEIPTDNCISVTN